VNITPYKILERYIGLKERQGDLEHPFIQWCFSLCDGWSMDTKDEVPWCSAIMQHPFWELRLPRSKSARARSWLLQGVPVELSEARPGHDVVIIKRAGDESGPEVIDAPGHVMLFSGIAGDNILGLGGNQSNQVSIAAFSASRLLGVRRIT
jgi:uncharacterized protein (TIGR02594 family)